ncbi:MAG: DUF4115 domain-containing protein [Myxococcota bacterium]|jgi:transcriptional regulator with XRE-family HTH domain|nr:DUF4115 domain-containing protein [Myxococcota bacterium]
MQDLRQARESRGLSLEEVSARVQIPSSYLDALETGRHEHLPPGPFVKGYLRQYMEFLGMNPSAEALAEHLGEDTTTDPSTDSLLLRPEPTGDDISMSTTGLGSPLSTPRMASAGIALACLALGVVWIGSSLLDGPREHSSSPATLTPQTLKLRALDRSRITVHADGTLLYGGRLEAGESRVFQGRERLQVETSDLTRLVMYYNGDKVEPLGNLSKGRRLVFLQRDGD